MGRYITDQGGVNCLISDDGWQCRFAVAMIV
jgi:hypothetical protein